MKTLNHIPVLLLGLFSLSNVILGKDLRPVDEGSLENQRQIDSAVEASSFDLITAGSHHKKEWKKGGGDEHHSDHHSSHGHKADKG